MSERYAVTLNEESVIYLETPKDLILFVPGTSDPVNMEKKIHDSYNKIYFKADRDNPFYPGHDSYGSMGPFPEPPSDFINNFNLVSDFQVSSSQNLEDYPNFLEQIQHLKKTTYPYLEIENNWFSWSGDNSPEERTKAGIALKDKIKKWFGASGSNGSQTIWLHLVGHSHGGNVINEFTKAIADDSKFPQKWVVKSITYLSTPFFKELHQVDETKFHPDCKIFNVYNEYDLTQRFVADYSVNDLVELVNSFEEGKKLIKGAHLDKPDCYDPESSIADFRTATNYEEVFGKLKNAFLSYEEQIEIWGVAINLFKGLRAFLINIITRVDNRETDSEDTEILTDLLSEIMDWTTIVVSNLEEGLNEIRSNSLKNKWYDNKVLFGASANFYWDLELSSDQLKWINEVLKIHSGPNDSFLFEIIEEILIGPSGIIKIIDDTSNSPEKQYKHFKDSITSANITELDQYHRRDRYENYSRFITKIENLVKSGNSSGRNQDNIREILFVLISQLDTQSVVQKVAHIIKQVELSIKLLDLSFVLFRAIPKKELIQELRILRDNVQLYADLFKENNYNLISPNDLTNTRYSLIEKPGSIGYLAMVSHSLSHMLITQEIKELLVDTFGSPKKNSKP